MQRSGIAMEKTNRKVEGGGAVLSASFGIKTALSEIFPHIEQEVKMNIVFGTICLISTLYSTAGC